MSALAELVRVPDADAGDEVVEIIARAIHTVFVGGDRWPKALPLTQARFRAEAEAAKRELVAAGFLREAVDA